jgi:hypothetical protein
MNTMEVGLHMFLASALDDVEVSDQFYVPAGLLSEGACGTHRIGLDLNAVMLMSNVSLGIAPSSMQSCHCA